MFKIPEKICSNIYCSAMELINVITYRKTPDSPTEVLVAKCISKRCPEKNCRLKKLFDLKNE